MRTHAAVEVVHGTLRAEVDEELAPLVLEVWRAGIPTSHSCQDMGENIAEVARKAPHLNPVAARLTGRANIGFSELGLLVSFYEALANSGPRDDFYERMLHWASPQAWELSIGVWDWGLGGHLDDTDTDTDDGCRPTRISAASFQVRFPCTDIAEMASRMGRHNRGEMVDLGTPSWSTLGFEEARLRRTHRAEERSAGE